MASPNRKYRAALDLAASMLWRVPGRFGIAGMLGNSYSLRCVVFHDVSVAESEFTRGMGVSVTPRQFEAALEFFAKYYSPVSLQEVLDHAHGRPLPPRAVLITFDDGYASLIEAAVPVCKRLDVPAVFFLNAISLNNERLSADNLVCYVANTRGMDLINAAARSLKRDSAARLTSFMDVFRRLFPSISLAEREGFLRALIDLARIHEPQLASEASLYLNTKQVRELASSNFEIGNHTRSHVHCRCLSRQEFCGEIDRNKMELEALSRTKVRSFSVPYGSSMDLSNDVLAHLKQSGHELIFLSQALANPCGGDRSCFDRVGPRGHNDETLFQDLEILPRLRKIRDWRGNSVSQPGMPLTQNTFFQ